jgi:hypothetical protein
VSALVQILLVFLIAAGMRMLPWLLSPHGAGIDHWFWRKYVETYRSTRRFPPKLEQYILDEHQWYPPLFPLLLSMLPARVFDALSRHISMLIDLVRLALLMAVAYWQTEGRIGVVVMAGLIYATIPIQTSYNIQLNPRGVAALMLDLLLIMLLWIYDLQAGAWAWVVVVVLAGLILLTHKMTTQLLWFIILGTAVIYQLPMLLLLIPASVAVAVVFSRGFYIKVLRAHWDIVSFWHRNWRWIGADLLRESPVYGDGTYERPEKLHRSGLRGRAWQLYVLFGFNPSAWIACLLVYERLFMQSPMLIYPTYLLVWLLLPCIFALLTTFVPMLRGVGAGYLYVYNTSFMASLVLALTFEYTTAPQFSTPFVLLALLLNMMGLLVYCYRFHRDERGRVDTDLDAIIDVLGSEVRGVVMCVPANWYEVVSYRTSHPVLWGAHGYGFKRIEPTWPRLLLPVKEVVRRYGVRYLLTMEGMLPESFVADLPPSRLITLDKYQLYCFAHVNAPVPSRYDTLVTSEIAAGT